MNLVNRHREINDRWGALPAVNSTGSFNFFDQSIVMSSFNKSDINSISKLGNSGLIFDKISRISLTAYHEYRHWIDMTSSTYGLHWLGKLLASCNSVTDKSSKDKKDVFRSISLFATEIHLPKYYSVLTGLDDDLPWQYSPTVGRAFTIDGKVSENHPLWFLNFSDAKNRVIGRQPVSVASLLEARAVEAEMSLTARVLLQSTITTSKQKTASKNQFTKEILSRVYSPSLTLYSTAAHWYANNRGNPDVADAYLSASKLAQFCLNAPSQWISELCASKAFINEMGPDAGYLMSKSLLRKDRAALYFMLAADKRLTTIANFEQEIDFILQSEWGNTLDELEKAASNERIQLLKIINLQKNSSIDNFLRAVNYNNGMNSFDTAPEEFFKLMLPAIYLHDGSLFNPFTFKTGESAVTGNLFDPSPHMKFFEQLEEILNSNKKYTELEPHCFAEN